MNKNRAKSGSYFDEFRQLVRKSGKTKYAIARDSGGAVDRASLCRFMQGKHGLSMPAIESIADQLNIRPTITAQAAGAAGRTDG